MHRKNPAEIGFGARIAREDKKRLEAVLQMNGGKTWWMIKSLEFFVEACEASAELQGWVHDEILRLKEEEPAIGPIEFQPTIPRALYDRFTRMFPERGANTWFIRNAVKEYLKVTEELPTHEDMVNIAVQRVLHPEAGTDGTR